LPPSYGERLKECPEDTASYGIYREVGAPAVWRFALDRIQVPYIRLSNRLDLAGFEYLSLTRVSNECDDASVLCPRYLNRGLAHRSSRPRDDHVLTSFQLAQADQR